ncbi:MAG: bifunctional folylpolyglutamate synthase/dihydrofolate synthase [Anaerolineae bacterium]|nr:bifunctional folylpolyglutamate synthase/dihydrofolate synthase [Anaerolineae bacterium]
MDWYTLNYQEAIDYLYGLVNYEVRTPERYSPTVVSLDRPRALLAELGNPQEQYPTIHLAGSKGKGSTSAICVAILQAAGLKVGFYSSPHLQTPNERFRIGNDLIEPSALVSLVERIQPVVERIPGLTFFEVMTALAFWYFAESKVDVAVIEVGLGGRLDATNILEKPLVSIITSLSFEHTHILGNTLGEIAFEKAGIIKPGVPVVSAPQEPEALAVIERVSTERHAPLTLVGRDFLYQPESIDEYGQRFTAHWRNEPPKQYWMPLLGKHQEINAAVALAALRHVQQAGFIIPDDAIQTGLRQVNWPGRLEVVRRSPYLVLDAAHNAASAQQLSEALTSIFHPRKLVLILGAFVDKDVRGIFKALLPVTSHLILVQAISPRAFSTEQLAAIAHEVGYAGPLETIPAVHDALARAETLAVPDDLICATGSLTVIGEIRSILGLAPARAAYLDEAAVQAMQRAGE